MIATLNKKSKLKCEKVEAKHHEIKLKDLPTLPDKVKEANQKDALFTEVSKYLANLVEHNQPTVYL